jgi:hypothetical protein
MPYRQRRVVLGRTDARSRASSANIPTNPAFLADPARETLRPRLKTPLRHQPHHSNSSPEPTPRTPASQQLPRPGSTPSPTHQRIPRIEAKAGRGWRRRARVDWWFHVATAISGAAGPRSWTALRFPGEAPPRARHDWAAAPVEGYGWERLRNSRRRRPPEEIARAFLTEFLTANGYYEFSDALETTIAEASRLAGDRVAADS